MTLKSLPKKYTFKDIQIAHLKYLKNMFPNMQAYISSNEIICKVPLQQIVNITKFLKLHTYGSYDILVDITAVDYPEKKNRFEIIYIYLSTLYNTRIVLTTFLNETFSIDSITSIHNAAGWYEREVWDMFGVYFHGNKDLRRILTDYGFKGHPLRKDFPLTGFTELRYNDFYKKINYENVSLSQDYRIFSFDNSSKQTN